MGPRHLRLRLSHRRINGYQLVELMVAISISSIVLPGLLSVMLEPLLSQLRVTALSSSEGAAHLLALKARQATSVSWDAASDELRFDGAPYPLPEGCSISGSPGSLKAVCSAGETAQLQHSTPKDLLSQHPCGGSDLYPMAVPDAEACRQALKP